MLDVHVGLKQDDVLKRGGGEKKNQYLGALRFSLER